MSRGLFSEILSMPGYQDAEKSWHITLERSEFFWFELVVDPPEASDTRQLISQYLRDLKRQVEDVLEKRFIYFYTSRKKVRFDTKRPPKYSLFGFGNNLILNLIIGGKERRKIVLPAPMVKFNGKIVRLKVSVDERFIYFEGPTFSTMASIHDFFRKNKISLGITSEVQYVGITKDPVRRTLSREHRGYADAIYFAPTSENDIFLTVNTFKVMSDATAGGFIRIIAPNSMTDEIPVGDEGAIIENALIHYFDAKNQEPDKETAWTKFKNLLGGVLAAKKINSISIHMELADPSEYDALGSRRIEPSTAHSFLWELSEGEPKLSRFNSEEEVRDFSSPSSNI